MNLNDILRQKQAVKLKDVNDQNEEVDLDSAGPFQKAQKGKST